MKRKILIKEFDFSGLDSFDLLVLIMKAMNEFWRRPLSIENANKLHFATSYHSEFIAGFTFSKLMAEVEEKQDAELIEASRKAMENCNYVGGKSTMRCR